jgi:hypothetical protein
LSSYKSIAGVTNSIVNLLTDRMDAAPTITVAPPDVQVNGIDADRLNIYLYHLSENAFLKNQEIPGEGHPGAYGNPPLSLNLHYILTAFGETDTGVDADVKAQSILGDAMRVLHDFPVISADLVQLKKAATPPILDPTLLDEFEQVKLSLQPKSLEEISRIWTALPRVNFRRSVTYEACTVQIESKQIRRSGLPVRSRRVYAITMQSPQIEEIFRQPPLLGAQIAVVQEGETLRLVGYNFAGASTGVVIDDVSVGVTPSAPPATDSQIDVVVPASQFSAGTHSLQVVRPILLTEVKGQPPVQRGNFSSNAVAFQLIPQLVLPAAGTFSPDASNVVTLTVTPKIQPNQQVSLLLEDQVFPRIVTPPMATATTIQFQLPVSPAPALPPDSYLMRVRVDGAESRLALDTNPASPTYLQYVGPMCVIP